MAGILNNKHRILDAIILDSGRAQAAMGEMRFRFYSFTDKHAVYQASGSHPVVADDATDRIYFEAVQDHQDFITPETDFNGQLIEDFGLLSSTDSFYKLGTAGFSVGGTLAEPVSGDDQLISRIASAVVANTATNFEQIRYLKTIEPLVAPSERNFDLDPKGLTIKNGTQFKLYAGMSTPGGLVDPMSSAASTQLPKQTDVTKFPYLWEDWHFEHLPNFRKLPPINKLPRHVEYHDVAPYLGLDMDLEMIGDLDQFAHLVDLLAGVALGEDPPLGYTGDVFYLFDIDSSLKHGVPLPRAGVDDSSFLGALTAVIGAVNVYLGAGMGAVGGANILTAANQNELIMLTLALFSGDLVAGGLGQGRFDIAKRAQLGLYDDTYSAPNSIIKSQPQTIEQIEELLQGLQCPSHDIKFSQSSQTNNIAFQFFDFIDSPLWSIEKMVMLDAGEFPSFDVAAETSRVVFVGKMVRHGTDGATGTGDGQLRYVNVFTIVLDNRVIDDMQDTVSNGD